MVQVVGRRHMGITTEGHLATYLLGPRSVINKYIYIYITMKERTLNGLALMLIHRDITVSISDVVDAFAAKYPRKITD